jgi:hypothetical protein
MRQQEEAVRKELMERGEKVGGDEMCSNRLVVLFCPRRTLF